MGWCVRRPPATGRFRYCDQGRARTGPGASHTSRRASDHSLGMATGSSWPPAPHRPGPRQISAIPNNADPRAAPPARTRLSAVPPWAAATASQMSARGSMRCPSRSVAPIGDRMSGRRRDRGDQARRWRAGWPGQQPRWRMPVDPTVVQRHGDRPPLAVATARPIGAKRLEPAPISSPRCQNPWPITSRESPNTPPIRVGERIRRSRIDARASEHQSAGEPDQLRQDDESQRDRPSAEAIGGEADDHHDAGIQTTHHASERQRQRTTGRFGEGLGRDASRSAVPREGLLQRGRHSGDRPRHGSP